MFLATGRRLFPRLPQNAARYIPRNRAAEFSDPTKGAMDRRISLCAGMVLFCLLTAFPEIDDRLPIEASHDLSEFEKTDLPQILF